MDKKGIRIDPTEPEIFKFLFHAFLKTYFLPYPQRQLNHRWFGQRFKLINLVTLSHWHTAETRTGLQTFQFHDSSDIP